MKTELEPQDIEAIAHKVTEKLKPILSKNQDEGEIIFDIDNLAKYLGVKKDWIYKRTQLNEIPVTKLGNFLRFRKTDIDKWIERNTTEQINPLSASLKLKIRK